MKRSSLFLTVTFIILSFLSQPLKADVGPKTSVEIRVHDAPDRSYYVTLLAREGNYGPWSNDALEEYAGRLSSDADRQAFSFFSEYRDPDGFCFIGNMSDDLKGKDVFEWSYYPPDTFKVLIYCIEDGTSCLSGICEKTAFYAVYDVYYGTSPLRAVEDADLGRQIFHVAVRVIATVLIEVLIALLFGYRDRKELRIIVITNLITQFILYALMALFDYSMSTWAWFLLFPLGELVVFVIETIVYCIGLNRQSRWKAFF